MRNHRTRALGLALLAVLALLLAACSSDGDDSASSTTAADSSSEDTAATDTGGPSVVASTSWVGAIAQAAGAGEVSVIAPSSVQHPPDYEPVASDLADVGDADFVVLAGFEGFAEQLTEAAGSDAEVITIEPSYDPAKLTTQIENLGEAFGTEEIAAENAADVSGQLEQLSVDLQETLGDIDPVVVSHMFTTEWVAFAGLEPAGVYGPEPITPDQVAELADLDPDFVFENQHMAGSGAAITEATDATEVDLINFPGDDLDLIAVAQQNSDTIAQALGG